MPAMTDQQRHEALVASINVCGNALQTLLAQVKPTVDASDEGTMGLVAILRSFAELLSEELPVTSKKQLDELVNMLKVELRKASEDAKRVAVVKPGGFGLGGR